MEKKEGSTVKIDSLILKRAEEFIQKEENKLRFVNKKHLVDIAVDEFLRKEEAKKR